MYEFIYSVEHKRIYFKEWL